MPNKIHAPFPVHAKLTQGQCSRLLLLLTYLLMATSSWSQGTTSKWFFGRFAGLDFTTNPPTAISGSVNTREGTSSICDAAGNLLFYTNGDTVYTRQHQIMANGTLLGGSYSTAQSAIIVKKPGSADLYYVFTTDNCGGPDGLSYSIVDMSLQAGMGQVTIKNVQLYTPTSEKLAAVRHCNGSDFWIVSHKLQSDTFMVFLLTAAGVNPVPVKTAIGSIHYQFCGGGSIKLSPNGRRLAAALQNGVLDVFDFDNSSGVVSNFIPIQTNLTPPYGYHYGCEFSPNGSKLYSSKGGISNGVGVIYQWDLCAGSATAIATSGFTLAQNFPMVCALQRAPNGVIYIARDGQPYLSGILNPDLPGAACNFTLNAVSIAPNTGVLGLPNFVTDDIPVPVIYTLSPFGQNANCKNVDFALPSALSASVLSCTAPPGFSVTSIVWNFGDPGSGPSNTSTLSNPTHNFSAAGSYTVKLVANYATCAADTFYSFIHIPQLTINTNTLLACTASATATIAPPGNYSYLWSAGSYTSASILGVPGGIYTVTASHPTNGCVLTETVQLATSISSLMVNGNFSVCTGSSATLNAQGAATYSWSTGSTASGIVVSPPTSTNYTLTGTNQGCSISTVVAITVSNPPNILVAGNFSICPGKTATLVAQGALSYNWSNGYTGGTATLSPTASTNYTLTGNNLGCSISTVVSVTVLTPPALTVSGIFVICSGNTTTLTAQGATSYTWSTGSTTSVTAVSPSATTNYTVSGTSQGCLVSSTLAVNVSKCTGLDEAVKTDEINIYPNPTREVLNVEIPAPATITVYDKLGRLIMTKRVEPGKLELDIRELAEGVYTLKTDVQGLIRLHQFIKQ